MSKLQSDQHETGSTSIPSFPPGGGRCLPLCLLSPIQWSPISIKKKGQCLEVACEPSAYLSSIILLHVFSSAFPLCGHTGPILALPVMDANTQAVGLQVAFPPSSLGQSRLALHSHLSLVITAPASMTTEEQNFPIFVRSRQHVSLHQLSSHTQVCTHPLHWVNFCLS